MLSLLALNLITRRRIRTAMVLSAGTSSTHTSHQQQQWDEQLSTPESYNKNNGSRISDTYITVLEYMHTVYRIHS